MQRIRSHRGATALALLLPGAARGAEQREHRERPDLAARPSALHRIGIVAPEVKVFELTASNQPVFRPDWRRAARP